MARAIRAPERNWLVKEEYKECHVPRACVRREQGTMRGTARTGGLVQRARAQGRDGGSGRDQPCSTWMTVETLFIPITTAREPSKGYKQGSDRTGLRLERSPGLSGQVDLREELRCMRKNATNS